MTSLLGSTPTAKEGDKILKSSSTQTVQNPDNTPRVFADDQGTSSFMIPGSDNQQQGSSNLSSSPQDRNYATSGPHTERDPSLSEKVMAFFRSPNISNNSPYNDTPATPQSPITNTHESTNTLTPAVVDSGVTQSATTPGRSLGDKNQVGESGVLASSPIERSKQPDFRESPSGPVNSNNNISTTQGKNTSSLVDTVVGAEAGAGAAGAVGTAAAAGTNSQKPSNSSPVTPVKNVSSNTKSSISTPITPGDQQQKSSISSTKKPSDPVTPTKKSSVSSPSQRSNVTPLQETKTPPTSTSPQSSKSPASSSLTPATKETGKKRRSILGAFGFGKSKPSKQYPADDKTTSPSTDRQLNDHEALKKPSDLSNVTGTSPSKPYSTGNKADILGDKESPLETATIAASRAANEHPKAVGLNDQPHASSSSTHPSKHTGKSSSHIAGSSKTGALGATGGVGAAAATSALASAKTGSDSKNIGQGAITGASGASAGKNDASKNPFAGLTLDDNSNLDDKLRSTVYDRGSEPVTPHATPKDSTIGFNSPKKQTFEPTTAASATTGATTASRDGAGNSNELDNANTKSIETPHGGVMPGSFNIPEEQPTVSPAASTPTEPVSPITPTKNDTFSSPLAKHQPVVASSEQSEINASTTEFKQEHRIISEVVGVAAAAAGTIAGAAMGLPNMIPSIDRDPIPIDETDVNTSVKKDGADLKNENVTGDSTLGQSKNAPDLNGPYSSVSPQGDILGTSEEKAANPFADPNGNSTLGQPKNTSNLNEPYSSVSSSQGDTLGISEKTVTDTFSDPSLKKDSASSKPNTSLDTAQPALSQQLAGAGAAGVGAAGAFASHGSRSTRSSGKQRVVTSDSHTGRESDVSNIAVTPSDQRRVRSSSIDNNFSTDPKDPDIGNIATTSNDAQRNPNSDIRNIANTPTGTAALSSSATTKNGGTFVAPSSATHKPGAFNSLKKHFSNNKSSERKQSPERKSSKNPIATGGKTITDHHHKKKSTSGPSSPSYAAPGVAVGGAAAASTHHHVNPPSGSKLGPNADTTSPKFAGAQTTPTDPTFSSHHAKNTAVPTTAIGGAPQNTQSYQSDHGKSTVRAAPSSSHNYPLSGSELNSSNIGTAPKLSESSGVTPTNQTLPSHHYGSTAVPTAIGAGAIGAGVAASSSGSGHPHADSNTRQTGPVSSSVEKQRIGSSTSTQAYGKRTTPTSTSAPPKSGAGMSPAYTAAPASERDVVPPKSDKASSNVDSKPAQSIPSGGKSSPKRFIGLPFGKSKKEKNAVTSGEEEPIQYGSAYHDTHNDKLAMDVLAKEKETKQHGPGVVMAGSPAVVGGVHATELSRNLARQRQANFKDGTPDSDTSTDAVMEAGGVTGTGAAHSRNTSDTKPIGGYSSLNPGPKVESKSKNTISPYQKDDIAQLEAEKLGKKSPKEVDVKSTAAVAGKPVTNAPVNSASPQLTQSKASRTLDNPDDVNKLNAGAVDPRFKTKYSNFDIGKEKSDDHKNKMSSIFTPTEEEKGPLGDHPQRPARKSSSPGFLKHRGSQVSSNSSSLSAGRHAVGEKLSNASDSKGNKTGGRKKFTNRVKNLFHHEKDAAKNDV